MEGAPDERAQAFTGAYLFTVAQVREAWLLKGMTHNV